MREAKNDHHTIPPGTLPGTKDSRPPCWFLFFINPSLSTRHGFRTACRVLFLIASLPITLLTSAAVSAQTPPDPNSPDPSLSPTGLSPNGYSTNPPAAPAASPADSNRRGEAEAGLIPWRTSTFTIVAQTQSIASLLADFGDQEGLRVETSPGVSGTISGKFVDVAPGTFLTDMCRAYGLSWLYVNGLLYIAANSEVNLIIRPLRYVDMDTAIQVLGTAGFLSSDGRIEKMTGSSMVLLSGIPKYLELAQQVLNSLDKEGLYHSMYETVIEVFPLNHAWAYDVNIGGASAGAGNGAGPVRVEGVATTLQRLINGGSAGSGTGPNYTFNNSGVPMQMSGVLPPTAAQTPPSLYPQTPGGESAGPQSGGSSQLSTDTSGSPLLPANPGEGPGITATRAQITADVRRNAVVIRDTRANMAFYEAAIKKLDVAVRVIEIDAAIVDVDLGSSLALGLSQVGVSSASGTNTIGAFLQSNPGGTPGNVALSGVFGTTQITASINALSQENKAHILSRPTVLTLDNYGALISQLETFYVNSTGQYVSNLYNVSAGLSLQVVPHVTEEPGGNPLIYMQVQIQDGTVNPSTTSSSIPTVNQSTLTTQALINRNQSLLIGGLFVHTKQKQLSGYPWLSKLPIAGYLFGVRSRQESSAERLFLITPRIVELNSKNLGDYGGYFHPTPTVQNAIDIRKAHEVSTPTPPPGNRRNLRASNTND